MTEENVEGDASPPGEASIDWAEVRRLYEFSATPVAAVQKQFGLTQWRLRQRRIAEGWTTRPPAAKPGPLQGRKPLGDEALEFRLNRLIATGTAILERRVAIEGMTETNARMLTELCRAQEIKMRSTRTKNGKIREKKNDDGRRDFRDDPAWLRAELTRRLDRLGQADGPARNPRGGDAQGNASLPRDMAEMGAG